MHLILELSYWEYKIKVGILNIIMYGLGFLNGKNEFVNIDVNAANVGVIEYQRFYHETV